MSKTSEMSDNEVEAETLLCSHPTSEDTSLLVDETKLRPMSAPRKKKERNVRVPTPIPPFQKKSKNNRWN